MMLLLLGITCVLLGVAFVLLGVLGVTYAAQLVRNSRPTDLFIATRAAPADLGHYKAL